MKIYTRIIAAVLATMLIVSCLPASAASSAPEVLPECEIDAAYLDDGLFYFASAGAELMENSASGSLLKIARWGSCEGEASVQVTMTDISARYGKDYTVRLYEAGLLEGTVRNRYTSESVAEFVSRHNGDEYNYSDAVADGSVTAADQAVGSGAFTEAEKEAITDAASGFIEAVTGTTVSDTAAAEAADAGAAEKDALAAAREKATGLADDRENAAYELPDASGNLTSDSSVYLTESIEEISDALNSAYIILHFADGVQERYLEILPKDNRKSDGTRQADFLLCGMDGAAVSGMYSSFTLKLTDDEPYVPDVLEFSAAEYYPEDGCFSVTVKRTGNLNSVLTAMLDTEDDTAIGGMDYSQVHARLTFAFGVSERTVRIPVRTDYIRDQVRFRVCLSDPQECTIGSQNSAYCILNKGDTGFRFASGTSASFDAAPVGASQDMSLSSVITGEKFCLPEMYQGSFLTNGECRSEALNEDGWLLYAHKHGDDVEAAAAFKLDAWHYDYSGYEVFWSRVAGKPTYGSTKFWSFTGGISFDTLYNKGTERWSDDVDRYYLSTDVTTLFEFHLYAHTGLLATNPSLEIYYVKPILRPFRVYMIGADPIPLIDQYGNTVDNTEIAEHANANEVLLLNSDSAGSIVTVTGNTVDISLRNNVSPICYISGIYLVDTETGEKVLVKTFPEGTTSASLELTNQLIAENLDFVRFKKNDSHGKYGEFTIQPELKNMPAAVHVEKNDYARITVWNDSVLTPVYSDAKEDIYHCSVGDTLRYYVTLTEKGSAVYDWERVYIETLRPRGIQKIDIYRWADSDYAMDEVYASEIRVGALLQEGQNRLTVQVKRSELPLFDTASGIFTQPFSDIGDYREYYIDADRVAGKRYELTAVPRDPSGVSEWYNSLNSSVRYSQNTFYCEGAPDQNGNILILSVKKADSTDYLLSGTLYYDDAALGGRASAEAWLPVSGAYYIVDSAHYGMSDDSGYLRTAPFHGIAGDFIRFKMDAAGDVTYSDVLLRKDNLTTESYETADGSPYTVRYYQQDLSNRVISSLNQKHPYIRSATASSILQHVTNVRINGMSSTITVHLAVTDPSTQSRFTYTYTAPDGTVQTKIEHPTGVDLLILNPVTHEIKSVFPLREKTETVWTLNYAFTADEFDKYTAGDLLYFRVTTDRPIGNGTAEVEPGAFRPVDIFSETTYAPVRSPLTLTGVNPKDPQYVTIGIDPTNHIPQEGNYYSLPVIGELTMMINAAGLSFGTAETETGGIRLFFGKQIMSLTKNNHFDGNGQPVSDTGFAIDSSNYESAFSEMKENISSLGSRNKLKAMSLGIPAWSFEPMAGIYLEFALYHDRETATQNRLEFVGGGGYIGCIGNFRYTYYMIVFGVPVYVGGDVSLALVGELGIAANENTHVFFDDPDQNFIDKLLDNSHFQFVFMAILTGNAYAGFGICGTLGLRGGFSLVLKFIANPMVTKSYPTVRSSGFEVTGMIKFWADAVLFTIPAAPFSWDLLKLGYFDDIDKLKESNPSGFLAPAPASQAILSKPRNEDESGFIGNKPALSSTFNKFSSHVIVNNSYDDPQQKLIALGDGSVLMVYLDDDKTREDAERTVLKYTVCRDGLWSVPAVLQDDGTADFSPSICDAGDDVIIAWVSRPADAPASGYRDYLSKNEIYTVRLNKATLIPGEIERLTDDDYYDTNPIVIYDSVSGDVLVVYSKSTVGSIETSGDFLNAVMPYSNGSVLMYMLYDGKSGAWVRDRFFENEIADSSAAEELLQEFRGQRFVPAAAFGQTNPIISDFTSDTAVVTNLNAKDIEDFSAAYAARVFGYALDANGRLPEDVLGDMEANASFTEEQTGEYYRALDDFRRKYTKPYGIYAYTVDKDNNLATENDREVFVQLYDFEEHKTWEAIQITNNNENDSAPQLIHVGDSAYLFWLHDGKEIRYINAADTMCETDSEGFVKYRTVTAASVDREIDGLSIGSYRAFADNNENLFVAWQQNSAPVDAENTGLNPTQDIYLAGYVRCEFTEDNYASWSDTVRMTDNGLLNDLPEFVDLGERLMMVNCQYNLDMNGDVYQTSNVRLIQTDYITVGSLEVIDAVPHTVPKNPGDTFDADIVIRNQGVKGEPGFTYSLAFMAGDRVLSEIEGERVNTSVPAGRTVTLTHRFTLPELPADCLDLLKIRVSLLEDGTDEPVISTVSLFPGTPAYEFTDLKAVQDGDRFVISGIARNIGSGKCDGSETVVICADGSGTAAAEVKLTPNGIGESVPFSVTVDIAPEAVRYGYANYTVCCRRADGTACSAAEDLRAALISPVGLSLNDGLEEITLVKGQALPLRAAYEPAAFFKNADILYAVDDGSVAAVRDGVLVGLAEGQTELRMTTAPYGGSKYVSVRVVNNGQPDSYSIRFEMNGHGEQLAPVTLQEGDRAVSPAAPAEEGWIFLGWYEDAACTAEFDFDRPVCEDRTAYAKWESVPVNPPTGDRLPMLLILLTLCGAVLVLRKRKADCPRTNH